MTERECSFGTYDESSYCATHADYCALCAHAAQALQEEVTRLVGANEHWHTRVEQLKLETEALQRRVAEAEGDATTLRGYINTYKETPTMTRSRLTSLEAQNAALREVLRDLKDHHCSGRCDEERHGKMMEKVNAALAVWWKGQA